MAEKICRDCGVKFWSYTSLQNKCYACRIKHMHKSTRSSQTEPAVRKSVKKRVRKRDCYKCQMLGFSNSGRHMESVEVHHIFYLSEGGPDEEWNLITLCSFCHKLVHSNKTYWQPKLLRLVGGSDWYNRIPNKDKLPYNIRKKIEMYAAEYVYAGNRGYIEL